MGRGAKRPLVFGPERLPHVVMAKVFSCLSWMDKMNAVEAIPSWSASLCSVEAWPWVANNPSNLLSVSARHGVMWCECICIYGQYFRNCHLTIPMPSEKGVVLLGQVAFHCSNLRSFHLRNPFRFSLSQRDQEQYVEHLKSIASKSRQFSCMSLLNMDYMPQDASKGIGELLEQVVQRGIQEHLRVLEFSHPNGISRTIAPLADFHALQKLKCPIQVFDTNLVLTLTGNGLRELHVVNDMSTHNEGFVDRISWEDISKSASWLRVQYIVQEREWLDSDLVPNPLIYSYVINSFPFTVDAALLEGIAKYYGTSLERFAHLSPDWDCIRYDDLDLVPTMYAELARCCPRLREVVLGVQVSAEALVLMAINRKQCRVCVDETCIVFDKESSAPKEENEDYLMPSNGYAYVNWWKSVTNKVTSLQGMMSKFLGYEWRPLPAEEYQDIVTSLTCLSPD